MKIPTIQFVFDRKKTATKTKKGIIEMRITYLRKRKYMTTGIRCFPSQWSQSRECVVNSTDAVRCNQVLLEMKKAAMKAIADMVDDGMVDLCAIPGLVRKPSATVSFIRYIDERGERRKVSKDTKKHYRAFAGILTRYGKIVSFSDISEKSIRDFDEWLHSYTWKARDRYGRMTEHRYSQSTIGGIHKRMKIFIGDAVVDGYLKENPYTSRRIRIDKGETRIDKYLTDEELERIKTATMPTGAVAEARDMFVFQCLTGLSYSDLMEFDFSQVQFSGRYNVYTSTRMKTGAEFTFVLVPEAVEILERYGYQLPTISNQKYNIKLKIVADAAGVETELTSHVGRRTAGYIWLNGGIPIEIVAKCLGHTSVRTTEKAYARILDKTVINAFTKFINK